MRSTWCSVAAAVLVVRGGGSDSAAGGVWALRTAAAAWTGSSNCGRAGAAQKMSSSPVFPRPTYISPAELKQMLTDKSGSASAVQVIDVRDSDFAGGHIKGALNRPADQFEDIDDVDTLIQSLTAQRKSKVVFHCMLSQVRGPTCAQRFLSRLPAAAEEGEGEGSGVEVYVLQGGFQGWARALVSDPELRALTADFVSFNY